MNDMEYTDKEYCLEVWGDWACFTRPELKVERVSYDVITPSAARSIFEAILFKRYIINISSIQWLSMLRPVALSYCALSINTYMPSNISSTTPYLTSCLKAE